MTEKKIQKHIIFNCFNVTKCMNFDSCLIKVLLLLIFKIQLKIKLFRLNYYLEHKEK